MSTALRRPPTLRAGDTVAVVAPSAPVDPARLATGVALLESWGLRVRLGEHVTARAHHDLLAGRDSDRADDLMRAWLDADVRAVLAARGGYGATRLLPLLDWSALAAATPTWLVGASDITALHAAVGRRLGLASLHAPMPAAAVLAGDAPDLASQQGLLGALTSESAGHLAGDASWCSAGNPPAGPVTGRLVGGNLALLTALMGTPDAPDTRGGIVLLEDVDEAPYRVDRMLTHLLACGWLQPAAGIALGSFERCGSPAVVRDVVADRLGALGVPVVGGLPLGHGGAQLSVVLGEVVTLDAGTASLSWEPTGEASRRSSSR